jgi:hypothetical protein
MSNATSLSAARGRVTRALAGTEIPECFQLATIASAVNALDRSMKSAMSAGDFMAFLDGKSKAERLAEYDRASAYIDGLLKLVEQAPSLDAALAIIATDSREQP